MKRRKGGGEWPGDFSHGGPQPQYRENQRKRSSARGTCRPHWRGPGEAHLRTWAWVTELSHSLPQHSGVQSSCGIDTVSSILKLEIIFCSKTELEKPLWEEPPWAVSSWVQSSPGTSEPPLEVCGPAWGLWLVVSLDTLPHQGGGCVLLPQSRAV